MKPSRFRKLGFLALVLLLIAQVAVANQVFDLVLIGQTGDTFNGLNLINIEPKPSINDNGNVAFVGTLQTPGSGVGYSAVFRWEGFLAGALSPLEWMSAGELN